MPTAQTPPTKAITALIYTDSAVAADFLRGAARGMEASGLRLTGLLQREEPAAEGAGCDMALDELWSGETIVISQSRGQHARGCKLVVGELLRAAEIVSASLNERPDCLILNKFGKTEAEGGGFRRLIANALEQEIPTLVAVPYRNLDAWRAFVGDLGQEIHLDRLDPQLGSIFDDRIADGDTQDDRITAFWSALLTPRGVLDRSARLMTRGQ